MTYVTQLISRRWLSENAFEVGFRRPEGFGFEPGQHIRFEHNGLYRDYSLISSSSDPSLSLCIRKMGKFSSVLAEAEIGSDFEFSGPHGYFLFQPSAHPAVWIATGTGIAPFVSMARSGINGFMLLHGVRSPADLYYEILLRPSASLYIPCLSKPSDIMPPDAYSGRVTGYIRDRMARSNYEFYLCGQREMIRDMTALLDEQFPSSRVYYEIFDS
jgi:ferredoxin-NADP reductase